MDSRVDAPLLVFVHLRKTAGTTLSYVMWRQFRRGAAIDLNAATVEAANRTWNAMTAEQRARVRCIRGHLPFGADLFAPRAVEFLTVLRDPVERVISEYFFNLTNAGQKHHAALTRGRITLDQYVHSELAVEAHNAQTRLLAGPDSGASPEAQLESAMTSLRDRIAVVGISERLDETLLLCRAVFGWRHVVYRRINVNRRRRPTATLAPASLAAIEEANSLDRRLYRFACARFEAMLHQHRVTPAQASRLRRASEAYGAIRRMLGFPREMWIEAQMAAARRRVAAAPRAETQARESKRL